MDRKVERQPRLRSPENNLRDSTKVARVEERPWRRVRAGERPIVPDIRGPHERPDPRCRQPAR
jgi:hypothetical protein